MTQRWPLRLVLGEFGDRLSRRRFLGLVGATVVVSSCGDDGDPDPPTTTSERPTTSGPPSQPTTTSEPSDF